MIQEHEKKVIKNLIRMIGDDPDREGLLETPHRVVKAFNELYSGYDYVTIDGVEDKNKVRAMLKDFDAEGADEMVILKGIQFVSTCEHHLMPFTGVAHVAYLPKTRVVGLSKLARIVEIYSRRLQIQERLTQQIANCLAYYLDTSGSACVIESTHSCMSCRGVKKQGIMITSALTGEFKTDQTTRNEFLQFVK